MSSLRERALAAMEEAERRRRERWRAVHRAQAERVAARLSAIAGEPVEPGDGPAVTVEGIRFVLEEPGARLWAYRDCDRCGEPVRSASPVESLADLGYLLAGEGWNYHHCLPGRAIQEQLLHALEAYVRAVVANELADHTV